MNRDAKKGFFYSGWNFHMIVQNSIRCHVFKRTMKEVPSHRFFQKHQVIRKV